MFKNMQGVLIPLYFFQFVRLRYSKISGMNRYVGRYGVEFQPCVETFFVQGSLLNNTPQMVIFNCCGVVATSLASQWLYKQQQWSSDRNGNHNNNIREVTTVVADIATMGAATATAKEKRVATEATTIQQQINSNSKGSMSSKQKKQQQRKSSNNNSSIYK
jgi:hypothetical protein